MCKMKYNQNCESCNYCGKEASKMLNGFRCAIGQITNAIKENKIELRVVKPNDKLIIEFSSIANNIEKYSSKVTH